MRIYLKNLRKLLLHKWYVFLECCKLGIPLLGILHDWTKLLPCEFFPYARWFYGERSWTALCEWTHIPKRGEKWMCKDLEFVVVEVNKDRGLVKSLPWSAKEAFDRAWNHHQKCNRHHCQWWVMVRDHPELRDVVILPMPDRYRKEMLADWIGAGRAYKGAKPVLEWYLEHRDDMLLHPETRAWIEEQLGVE